MKGGGDELTIGSISHYNFNHLQNTISHAFENYASCLDIVIMVITFIKEWCPICTAMLNMLYRHL